MFRNYLAAALRNLARNRLYAGINIVGLAVGFAAAILIALFVRDEFSYDRWLPNADRTYLLTGTLTTAGREAKALAPTPAEFAAWMRLDFPQVEAVGRLARGNPSIRRGDIEENESFFYWADPDIAEILELPIIAGNLQDALKEPDGIALTRAMARKYFGKDAPIGETIEINRKNVMKVMAVLEDLPSNTHLKMDFLASGRAEFSGLTNLDAHPQCAECYLITVYTYFRMKPGTGVNMVQSAMPDFFHRHKQAAEAYGGATKGAFVFPLISLPDLHLHDELEGTLKPPGSVAVIYAVSAIGMLILLVGGINFVNLMTARAVRRATEVGIRKVSGASRGDLIVQFLGEAVIYVALGTILALALVTGLLSSFNAFLDRTIIFDWHDPTLVAGIVGVGFAVGILAGFYPAFVLSAFKPAAVLKGGHVQTAESGIVRQSLVILQFAILIGLILSTGIIYRQTQYALNEGMRLDTDQVLFISIPCSDAFKDESAALKGVKAIACSSFRALNFGELSGAITASDGTKINVDNVPVDFGFFEFYGLHPLAGRFFSRDRGADALPADKKIPFEPPVVVNEEAARLLGFATPAAAIGKTLIANKMRDEVRPSEIIGVVTDFSIDPIHKQVPPTFYFVDQTQLNFLHVKLAGRDIPETLDAIKGLWKKLGPPRPITVTFLDRYVRGLYNDVTRQAELFAMFAGIAIFIACLGLFGLAAFTAERRTKEIGIRKAMGASRWDIVKLLVWQFTKPVLTANLIAWPVGYYFLNRWLHGFAYHVDLEPWIFFASGGAALVIALATVSAHAYLVARARPVTALRYE